MTLDQLPPNTVGIVKQLHTTGLNRRRLMDLGILPGTRIEVEVRSPLGNPTAYRVRGAVIALRREQTREIELTTEDES